MLETRDCCFIESISLLYGTTNKILYEKWQAMTSEKYSIFLHFLQVSLMSGLIKASWFACLLLPWSCCDITGHDRLWTLQGTHIWAKRSRTRLSGWAQTMEQSFQGCALSSRETHKGWDELRKLLGETGVQRPQQRGIAWQQNNPGGRKKWGKEQRQRVWEGEEPPTQGRAALNKGRGGWWMGRWPPHPLQIRASFVGHLISGGLR